MAIFYVYGSDSHNSKSSTAQRVVLPSTHIGSERHMYQLFQDSMAICRTFHKPDLFLTITANPNWREVEEAMNQYNPAPGENAPMQTPPDRPKIVARVFDLKMKALLKEVKEGIFGECVARIHTIEFQKRGLPHMHLLIFLDPEDKVRDARDVDEIVSAQIPDPYTHPRLYKTVTSCMIHGPCGNDKPNAPCMADGRCTKKYPRDFRETACYGDDGYPLYARPENGRTFSKNGRAFDNRDVVPYNPYLSAKYDCYINVEICASINLSKR